MTSACTQALHVPLNMFQLHGQGLIPLQGQLLARQPTDRRSLEIIPYQHPILMGSQQDYCYIH